MITIDYDVRDQVPPILESDIDKNLVVCWTDYRLKTLTIPTPTNPNHFLWYFW